MSKKLLELGSYITSIRELARNPEVRQKALKESQPIVVENKREENFFVLLPPKLYNKLFDLYRDMRDRDDLLEEIASNDHEWEDWSKLEKVLDKKIGQNVQKNPF